MPKRFSRWWFVACTVACINAHPSGQRSKVISYDSTLEDLLSAASSDYDFDDILAEKFIDKINAASNEEVHGVSSTTARNNNIRLPLILEPDAEMLPAHYTGVKPPGVDHMELKFFDSATMGSDRKNSLVDGTKIKGFKNTAGEASTSGSEISRDTKGESGTRRKVEFEKSLNGEVAKENRKGEYDESAGKKKTQEESEKHVKGQRNEAAGEKSVSFEIDRHREKGHNAAGFHNVYHKDEYKKDADFYDNDHEGGRFHKHGHYDEKHIAKEGDFHKGGKQTAAFVETTAGKSGNFERGRKKEEANGRAAKSGYDGFFDKFEEFAKKSSNGVGQSFGVNHETAKAR